MASRIAASSSFNRLIPSAAALCALSRAATGSGAGSSAGSSSFSSSAISATSSESSSSYASTFARLGFFAAATIPSTRKARTQKATTSQIQYCFNNPSALSAKLAVRVKLVSISFGLPSLRISSANSKSFAYAPSSTPTARYSIPSSNSPKAASFPFASIYLIVYFPSYSGFSGINFPSSSHVPAITAFLISHGSSISSVAGSPSLVGAEAQRVFTGSKRLNFTAYSPARSTISAPFSSSAAVPAFLGVKPTISTATQSA